MLWIMYPECKREVDQAPLVIKYVMGHDMNVKRF